MNIWRKSLTLAVHALLIMGALALNGIADDTVIVTFSGTLLAKSCDVTTGSKDQPVQMGTYDANDFLATGDVSPSQSFTIALEGCPTASSLPMSTGTSANVKFTGDVDTDNTALLRLTAGQDTATGIGIEILDSNDTAIAINGETEFQALDVNKQGDASLTFKLRYKSTQNTVHAGQANALLYFDIDYQ